MFQQKVVTLRVNYTEMTILSIETSTQVCSAAVSIGGVPIAERILREGGNHAEQLPVFISELIEIVQHKGLSIEAIALSEGPGSYTGLRIGSSTAKGLCYGWQVPLIPIPTLHILCASMVAQHGMPKESDALLCPMIDARRMEVYTALFSELDVEIDAEHQRAKNIAHPQIVEDSEWLPAGKTIYYFGDGAAKCQALLESSMRHYVPDIVPEARYMGVIAEQMLMCGYKGADVAYYEPYYLKEFVAAVSHVKGLN